MATLGPSYPPPTVAFRWCAVLLLSITSLAMPTAGMAKDRTEARLARFWDHWLAETEPLLNAEERTAFLELDQDLDRERFVAELWRARGEGSLEIYRRNVEDARQLRSLAPARTRALLVAGKPAEIEVYQGCRDRLRPIEVWRFGPRRRSSETQTSAVRDRSESERSPRQPILVFVQRASFDPRTAEVWSPGNLEALTFGAARWADLGSFLRFTTEGCLDETRRRRLRSALGSAVGFDELRRIANWPKPRDGWLDDFRQALEEQPFPSQAGRLELDYPGRFGRHTILRGRVRVPSQRLRQLAPGRLFDRVTITGDLFNGPRLVDSFEFVHHVAGSAPASGQVELDFYRRLRTGRFRLRLRVADRNGLAILREQRELSVPAPQQEAPPPAGRAGGYSLLTRSEVVLLDTFPSVEILPVGAKAAAHVEVRAITNGGPIAEVEMLADGVSLSVDNQSPYSFQVVLENDQVDLEAIARDPSGLPLARHRRTLTRDSRPFFLRFTPAPDSDPESGPSSVRGQIRGEHVDFVVSVPQGERLSRVDCFHRGRLLERKTFDEVSANLGAPSASLSCPLPAGSGSALDYVRAVATLTGGAVAEDVMFLGRASPDELEVRLVELFVSVFDTDGRPALGLGPSDFRVSEESQEQRLVRVESLDNLPLDIAILMDISSSMGRRVRLAVESAERFFDQVLTDEDRASLVAFNHDLHLLVPFTSDRARLEYAARGLRAWGSTRLFDAIVYSLFQFSDLGDRRALILLSDGADVDSDYRFEQVLAAAQQAGVALYPISLRSGRAQPADEHTTAQLQDLASGTGGTAFSVGSVAELDDVYRRIEEELRSRYLVVYRPSAEPDDLDFRAVEVEVLRAGLSARNIHGR